MSSAPSRTNHLYSILGVALVLFLLGTFALGVLHAQKLVAFFKERVNVLVEVTEGTARSELSLLEEKLEASSFVKPGSVLFISREAAAEQMRTEFGEDFLKLDLPNPFFDMLVFNVRAEHMQADSLRRIRRLLIEDPVVQDVFYQESLIDQVAANVQRLFYFSLGLGIFFIAVAVLLIFNTVRLSLYANRFLIKTMELVGASWGFISKPFFWRATGYGFISGLLALGGLMVLLLWAWQSFPELRQVEDWWSIGAIALGILVLGILLYAGSTYLVVNKYLRMRVDDLY